MCILQTLLDVKGYSFFNNNQHYKQMIYIFILTYKYTKYAAFHLFKFQRKEITGVPDFNVLSFISNFM